MTVILEGKRINYQLKNSSTKGAWNEELEIRFDLQAKLDEKYHKVEGKSILVCSDKATVEKNKHKIPDNISG